jgi:hypothetical protein
MIAITARRAIVICRPFRRETRGGIDVELADLIAND